MVDLPPVQEMTPTEYARHRGFSRQHVHRLLDAGKIPYRGAGRRRIIDVAAADYALGETRERVSTRSPDDDAPVPSEGFGGPSSALTKAKTASEMLNARIRALELAEKEGKVIPVDAVRRAMELCAGSIVRDLERIPAMADDLAVAMSRGGVSALREVLKTKAREIRETLARNLRTHVSENDADDD